MPRPRLLFAALAGLAVSFLVFVGLMVLMPDPDLVRGEGEVSWQRFQFEEERHTFTRGSVAIVTNHDPVPLDLVITDPGGERTVHPVEGNASVEIALDTRGTYTLSSENWRWGHAELEVRHPNPVLRFFEGLF